jgi:hypothetical protein
MPIKPQKKRGHGVVYRSAAAPVDPPKCIPIPAYEKKYFVTRDQIMRRLAKKLLCAVSLNGQLFIEDVPPPDL